MAINFPNTPTLNEIVTIGNITWTWTGSTWSVLSTAGGGGEAGGISNVVEDTTPELGGDLDGLGNKVLFANVYDNLADLPSAATYHGMFAHVHSEGKAYYAHAGAWVRLADYSEVSGGGGGGGASSLNDLSDVTINSPQENEVLKYSAGEWSNGTDATGGGGGGSSAFTDLTDVPSGLTPANFYESAITTFRVDNNSTSAYTFNSHYTGDNPTIYAISGTTIAFDLSQISGHPFEIQDSTGTAYNTGLVHVATDGTVSTGSNAQGKSSGVLYWRIQESLSSPPNYRYQCQSHTSMVGPITIKRLSTL